jgi:hypothetical protein
MSEVCYHPTTIKGDPHKLLIINPSDDDTPHLSPFLNCVYFNAKFALLWRAACVK